MEGPSLTHKPVLLLFHLDQPAEWQPPTPGPEDLALPLGQMLFNIESLLHVHLDNFNDQVLALVAGLLRRCVAAEGRIGALEELVARLREKLPGPPIFRSEMEGKHIV